MQQKTSTTIFAWLLAFLFVFSAMGVIFSYFPVGQLLNPEFYKQTLDEVDIYQRLPESLAAQLAGNLTPSAGDADSGISFMIFDDQAWESVLLEIVDPAWIQSQFTILPSGVVVKIAPEPPPAGGSAACTTPILTSKIKHANTKMNLFDFIITFSFGMQLIQFEIQLELIKIKRNRLCTFDKRTLLPTTPAGICKVVLY